MGSPQDFMVYDDSAISRIQRQTQRLYGDPLTLQPQEFHNYLSELRWQPSWRNEADKAVDYYDGNQLDAETLALLENKGMGPLINNVIAPVINVVLGMEAKTRTDWRVTADDQQNQPVAEALSAKMIEVERQSRADRACADGYAGQIKAGMGWVEVSRSANPFEYPYRVESIHRREVYWDWRDQSPDLKKSRFLLRKRWYDVDQGASYFPDHKDILRDAVGDPYRYALRRSVIGTTLNQSFEFERGLDIEDFEQWRQMDRRRICFYEVWYRRWQRGNVISFVNGDVAELDPKNPMHMQALAVGTARVSEAVYAKMRMSIWAGPHKVHDCACADDGTPYVPFWGYREDRTGVPYGLIRSMISPQDEVNARRQKMMWLLGAKRLIADSDAIDLQLNDWATVMQEIGRPDAAIMLNKARQNKDGFQIDDNIGMAKEQFEVLMEAKHSIQEVVGVFQAMLGEGKSGQSGQAISSLVEQGTAALAEINDNYRFSRRAVGEKLMALIRQDLIGQQVTVQTDMSGVRKSISLNTVMKDPSTGQQFVVNDVASTKVRVALEDVPSSPSYRAQQFTMLSEVMKGMPPQLQAAIAPYWMEASDLQQRKQMANAIRKALGQQVEPSSPEEAQAMEAAMREQEELKQYNKAMAIAELQKRQAEVNELNAKADKLRADADGNPDLAGHQAEAQKAIAEAQEAAKEQIDAMTVEIMTLRNSSALKELQLREQVAKAQRSADNAEMKAQSEERRAELEREIAEMQSNAQVRVAELEAERNEAAKKMIADVDKRIAEIASSIQRIERMEQAEATREAKEKKGEKAEAKPVAAPPVNVEVKIESGAIQVGGGSKSMTIKKNADGSYTGTSSPKE